MAENEASQAVGPLRAALLKQQQRQKSNNGSYTSYSSPEPYAHASPCRWSAPSGATGSSGRQQHPQDRLEDRDGSGLSWHSICRDARAAADRKRGFQLSMDDAPELKQWLISDVIGQLFSAPAPDRRPPSRSSALTPRRCDDARMANWPGADVYVASTTAAAEERMGMTPPGPGLRRPAVVSAGTGW